MKTAYEVAQFFLHHTYEGERDQISNLKLQKLLYYAQGYSLAILDRPLFDEPIECWRHGPVVESVYHCYKHYRDQCIPSIDSFNDNVFDYDDLAILNRIALEYGQYSPWKLRDMTHEERPWKEAYAHDNNEISCISIKNFFKELLDMTDTYDDKHAYSYDVEAMQVSIDSGAIRVPDFTDGEDFVSWLNG